MNDNNDTNAKLPKSKSKIKREMNELQELGERLTTLSTQQIKRLPLPENLAQAIYQAQKITSRGAKRRQFQYIGRLMREVDDVSPITDFFNELDAKSHQSSAFLHMLESWRDKLLSDDANAVTEFITLYPNADRQHLRQLIQNGKKERLLGKPLGACKLLFRYIKELHKESEME